MKLEVKTLDNAAAGDIELSDAVFGKEPRTDILHRVVTWQLEKRRATARKARERSEVKRTGKKLGNQKGGGTARHGNRAAPQFIGGGKAHGPRVRDFDPGLNKKIRRLGLGIALSVKAGRGQADRRRGFQPRRSQDQDAARPSRRPRHRLVGVVRRWRCGQRALRPGVRQPAQDRRDAGDRRERLRHPQPRHAGPDPRRGCEPGGARQWLRQQRPLRRQSTSSTTIS